MPGDHCDSKEKRLSATHFLFPGFAKGVYPAGHVEKEEREDVTWAYRGIDAGAPAPVSARRYEPWKRVVGRARWR
jgi:hypothetical protein